MSRSPLCDCGHAREDHATASHRGICFECYGASDHGALPYCNRFRNPKPPARVCSFCGNRVDAKGRCTLGGVEVHATAPKVEAK